MMFRVRSTNKQLKPPGMIHVKNIEDGKQTNHVPAVCVQICVGTLILGNQSSNDGSCSQRQKDRNGQLNRCEKFKNRGNAAWNSFVLQYRVGYRIKTAGAISVPSHCHSGRVLVAIIIKIQERKQGRIIPVSVLSPEK